MAMTPRIGGADVALSEMDLNRPLRSKPPGAHRRDLLTSVAKHSVAIFFAVIFLLPFVFVLLTAVMTPQQALTAKLWPSPFVWSNFTAVFKLLPFWRYTFNTVLYATLATIGVVVSSVPVAYAFARMRWKGREGAFLLLLATLMLPAQVTIVPLFVFFTGLNLVGSLWPLIIPTFFGDAFSIFLLRQFFLTIPQDLIDAAKVDGASEFQIMWHVVVKLAKPAIAAIGLFQFLFSWNDFFGPLVYTGSNPNIWTLSVGLQQFTTVHRGVLWNVQMAASLLFMLPVIVLFILAQKVFIEGVTLTGVKG
jgi:ABC-type sugar transport system, permease component